MNYFNKFKAYPLTYSLMAISIVLFLLGQLSPTLNEYLYMNGVLHGYSVVVKGEWSRLFISIFLHSSAMHIVMNMLSLYMVGTVVEKIFSKRAYLGIYFVSALIGSFSSIYVHLGGQAVGASGAIFGLFGALAGFAFVHRITMREQFMSFIKDFGVILLINLVIGFVFPAIDVSAHVGGLVAGMVGGFMIAKNPKYLWAYVGIALVLVWLSYGYLPELYAHY